MLSVPSSVSFLCYCIFHFSLVLCYISNTLLRFWFPLFFSQVCWAFSWPFSYNSLSGKLLIPILLVFFFPPLFLHLGHILFFSFCLTLRVCSYEFFWGGPVRVYYDVFIPVGTSFRRDGCWCTMVPFQVGQSTWIELPSMLSKCRGNANNDAYWLLYSWWIISDSGELPWFFDHLYYLSHLSCRKCCCLLVISQSNLFKYRCAFSVFIGGDKLCVLLRHHFEPASEVVLFFKADWRMQANRFSDLPSFGVTLFQNCRPLQRKSLPHSNLPCEQA